MNDAENKPDLGQYRIVDLLIDETSRTVTRNATQLDISGLTFDVLLKLCQCAPGVASYDDLKSVWPIEHVETTTLTKRIALLRKALGETPGGESLIEAVRNEGYRLKALVEHDLRPRRLEPVSRRPMIYAGLSVLTVLMVITLWALLVPSSPVTVRTLISAEDGSILVLCNEASGESFQPVSVNAVSGDMVLTTPVEGFPENAHALLDGHIESLGSDSETLSLERALAQLVSTQPPVCEG